MKAFTRIYKWHFDEKKKDYIKQKRSFYNRRRIGMQYKKDWESTRQRFDDYWKGENTLDVHHACNRCKAGTLSVPGTA